MFIGLMGLENDGKTLISPNGNWKIKLPKFIARNIQHIQHFIAIQTWK